MGVWVEPSEMADGYEPPSAALRPPPSWIDEATNEPPTVQIERVGRWLHMLTLVHGIMAETPSTIVFGERWANNKAKRMLRSYERRERYRQEARTIVGDTP